MKTQSSKCSVIIVTNNSEKHIHKALQCLNEQTVLAHQIIIVDTGSKDLSYLTEYHGIDSTQVIVADPGIGFCRGNNIGMNYVSAESKYVFFLNPDAFLTPPFLEKAIQFMEQPANSSCGALTGTTLGYDIAQDKATGKYDTTGVFRKWYGKWYDRAQGDIQEASLYQNEQTLPAICGAVYFCRKKALEDVKLRKNEVFDSTFYMYKEDIDLSLRLRKKGWNLKFLPDLVCYHCRGWNRNRKKMPRDLRIYSARNELKVQVKGGAPIPILYSLLKYASVKILDI